MEGKPARVDGRGFGVVRGTQVVEHCLALRPAKTLAQRVEEHRPPRLGAAVRPEPCGEQRADGYDVSCRVRRNRDVRLLEAGVEACHVRLDRRDHALASLPGLREQLHLLGQKRLALGARQERRAAERELRGVDAGDVERGGTSGPANELEQEATVLDGYQTCAVGDIRGRPARDVGHTPPVALDDEACARPEYTRRLADESQRRILEAAPEVFGPHAVEERRQALVELRLVVRVPVEDEAAVLPGWQDIEGERRVILAAGLGRGGRQRRNPEDDHRDGSHPQHVYPSPGSTRPHS